MKKTFLFTFVLLSFNLIAQVTQLNDGFYVTNNNDTIKCQFKTHRAIIGKKIDYVDLFFEISIVENGVNKKFKPLEIKSFTVYDIKDTKYKFGSYINEIHFVNILIEGCLTLGNAYSYHRYDYSYIPVTAIIKDGIVYRIIGKNKENNIRSIISDSPEILEKWTNNEYKKTGIEQLVKDYNENMCKNK